MRLQADVEALRLDTDEKRQERANDTLASMNIEKVLSELEQMRFLARVKL